MRRHVYVKLACVLFLLAGLAGGRAMAQPAASTSLDSYGLKIFKVESALYPFVQVYFRTFDQEMQPLVNLNELNIGLMVKGRSYDVTKRQFRLESIRNRKEAVRTVIVMDCSRSMAGGPFQAARMAFANFIDSKRPQDQVAVLAVRDTQQGYELVSNFERDPGALGRRMADIECDGMTTRLYDAIGAALQMCGTSSAGGETSSDADYVISNAILVCSDGKDEGSAISRAELNSRIGSLKNPVPVYSLAYSTVDNLDSFRNLEALSKNSFGVYYNLGRSFDRMQRCIENVQNIQQNDYVLTCRIYGPIDGEPHPLKLGLEYPSRSGKMIYQNGKYEAIQTPPVQALHEMQMALNAMLPPLDDNNPYLVNPTAPAAGGNMFVRGDAMESPAASDMAPPAAPTK